MPRTRRPGSPWLSKANQLCAHVGDLRAVGVALHESESAGKHLIGVARVAAHACNRELGELPAILLADLSRRDVQLLADATQQSADNLPLRFQRSAFGQVQHDAHHADGHGRSHHSVRLGLVATGTSDLADLGREIVKASYLKGEFTLRSGKKSDHYFDKFLFETDPALLRRLGRHLAELVPADTQVLAAPELGAVLLGGAVSMQMGLPLELVRNAQLEVIRLVVVLDRGEGGAENIGQAGVPYSPLFRISDLTLD